MQLTGKIANDLLMLMEINGVEHRNKIMTSRIWTSEHVMRLRFADALSISIHDHIEQQPLHKHRCLKPLDAIGGAKLDTHIKLTDVENCS